MLFAFDLDGTFLNTKHEVPESNIEIIKYLKSKGHTTVICTGRTISDAEIAWKSTTFDYVIGANGTEIYDIKNKKNLRKIFGNKEEVIKMVKNAQEVAGRFYVHSDIGNLNISYNGYSYDGETADWIETKPIEHLSDELVEKYADKSTTLGISNWNSFEEVRKWKDRLNITNYDFVPLAASSQCNWCDIKPKGINKSEGIKFLINFIGLNEDQVIMFGDSMNDKEAMQDYYSIAMDNGNEDIKKMANENIGNNDQDSIAKWIKSKF